MKNNRVISIALAIVMTLLSSTFVMAEEKEKSRYAEEMKVMSALGFLRKLSVDDENAAVTKGMFAAAVMDLLGVKSANSGIKSPFTDVNSSTQYYNEICLAAQYGVVHGDETPKFEPDSMVTYIDAAVMLINALGYHDYAVYEGGYPNGYLKIASNIGLSDKLNLGDSAKLSTGMCARILLNAGEAKTVSITPYQSGYKVVQGDDLFWAKHKIVKDTGIVLGNEFTSLESEIGVGKNSVQIGNINGTIYYSNEGYDYLGYNVDFYYRDNNGENTILYMQPKRTEITVINSMDINAYSDGKLSYNIGTKEKTATISKGVPVIYNGVFTLVYSEADGSSIFFPKDGEIKLVDNNNDGKVDVVSILSYENLVVSAVDRLNGIVYDKYDEKKTTDFLKAETDSSTSWIVTDSRGTIMNYSEFAVWDVISVAKSFNEKVLRAVVNRKTIVGKVTSVSTDERGEIEINVDGAIYYVSRNYPKNNLPESGSNVTFYLDYYGKIAAINLTNDANQYGFLIRTITDSTSDVECMLRLMNDQGIVSIVPCAAKVKIDGTTVSGGDLVKKMTIDSKAIENRVVSKTELKEADNSTSLDLYQVIVYRTNANGEVNYIDTVYQGEGEGKNTLHALNPLNKTYYYYNTPVLFGSGSSSVCVDPKGLLFKTPAFAYMNDIKDYGMGSFTSLVYGTNYNIRGYTTNPDSVIPEAVHMQGASGSDSLTRNARTCVIKSITEGINSDDERVTFLNYYSGKTEYNDMVLPEIQTSKFKPGDIVKVMFDNKGQISVISHVYDVSTNKFSTENKYPQSDFGNEYQPYASRLYILDSNVIGLADEITDTTTFESLIYHRVSKNDTAIYIVRANGRNGKTTVEPVEYENIGMFRDYHHNKVKTPVFLMTTYAVSKFLVVYEKDA